MKTPVHGIFKSIISIILENIFTKFEWRRLVKVCLVQDELRSSLYTNKFFWNKANHLQKYMIAETAAHLGIPTSKETVDVYQGF